MTYRFTMISSEADDFVRELRIDADDTFYSLHRAILSSCGYADNQFTSFRLCNENWEEEQEVLLEDMGTSRSDEDVYLMRDTRLSDLLEEERQRLVYVFDPLAERMFFIELTEIEFGQPLSEAVCSRRAGEAPAQTADIEELFRKEPAKVAEDLNEDFYGSESFDSEEFDPEGFEISEGNPYA